MKRKLCKKLPFTALGVLFITYLAFSLLINGHMYSMQEYFTEGQSAETRRDIVMNNFDACGRERTNFVFIKCMKCATETMATIIRRFGYVRNLNFALPIKRNLYFGWPFPIELKDVRPSKFDYNILMEHSIYNRSVMRSFMPNNTVYISIIRHPWNHFKSTFNYFDLGRIANVPNKNITEYLEHLEKYEAVYMSPENNQARWCIPDGFSLTKNIMSHCLGMPLGFPAGRQDITENNQHIQQYINTLDDEFSLIMIADYFQESLVLLKLKMCWGFKDIVYHRSNVGQYAYKSWGMHGHLYDIHRNWSRVDYMLYEHFNKTFWNKVQQYGQRFYDELEHFRLIQMIVERFCFVEQVREASAFVTIPRSKFGDEFNITGSDCSLMNTYMLPMLWSKYYEREGLVPENFGKIEERPRPAKGCSI